MRIDETKFLRQMDICPPEKLQFPITVIGTGAVGSATVLALAKMGCGNIMVWDHDILEPHNVSNQICKPSMIGQPKVEALRELVAELTDVQISTRKQRYSGQRLEGVVIASVDNMTARQEIWHRAKLNPNVPVLIDPRMGAEFARLYSIRPCDPDQIDFYEANLYSANEAEHLPCSARSIIYCPVMLAGLVAVQVKGFAVGMAIAKEILLDVLGLILSCGGACCEAL